MKKYIGGNVLYLSSTNDGSWQDIGQAPRDGTVIELRNTYGVAPWYGLSEFVDGKWQMIKEPNQYAMETEHLTWRPYNGNVEDYVDPTNGRQNTQNYWLIAGGQPPVPGGDEPWGQESKSFEPLKSDPTIYETQQAKETYVKGMKLYYPGVDPRMSLLGMENGRYITKKYGHDLVDIPSKFDEITGAVYTCLAMAGLYFLAENFISAIG